MTTIVTAMRLAEFYPILWQGLNTFLLRKKTLLSPMPEEFHPFVAGLADDVLG